MKSCYVLFSIIYYFFGSLNEVFSTPTDFQLSVLGNMAKPRLKMAKREIFGAENPTGLEIHEMAINSRISNRYAHTVVTSKIVNIALKAKNATFSVVLPNDAFITEFVMELAGKNYTSFVVDNKEARKQFDSVLANGLRADHMSVSARDSNVFSVSIYVKPNSHNTYYLTYQELLRRKHGRYEHVITISPGQPVQNLHVQVSVNEEGKLKNLEVLPLRTGNEIENKNLDLDPRADIAVINNSSVVIKFLPDIETQKRFARLLKTDESNGLFAQLVVQYDVDLDQDGGEMLTKDCYFVNFFAPTELQPLSKHVVFVLDVSGSMNGNKLIELKQAMKAILGQLRENDRFSITTFCKTVHVWNLDNPTASITYSHNQNLNQTRFPNAYPATAHYISIANSSNSQFQLCGYTDILTSLEVGLRLVELERLNQIDNVHRQPLIVFLTDGEPNFRDGSTKSIIQKVTALNSGMKRSSIYPLSFGTDADQNFLERLALQNNGTFKHIYDDKDSAKQLETFFDEISSPILINVSFNFNPSQVSNLTKTHFPVLYRGSEIVVSGQCGISNVVDPPEISAMSSRGPVKMRPTVRNSFDDVSRLWAFMTVKELLENRKINSSNIDEIDKDVVGLAVNNSFVTDLTSMVITSPQESAVVGTDEIEDGLCAKPHPKAEAPNPDYIRPERAIIPSPTASQLNTELNASLPWLKNIFNANNSTITLPTGNYKLESNESMVDYSICWNSPTNGPGKCTLLSDCSIVHPLIESVDVYAKHFCTLRKQYAGICCTNADENDRIKISGALNLIYFMFSMFF